MRNPFFGWLMIVKIAFTMPFLGGFEHIMGLVILGIALYEAWIFTKQPVANISGPYQIGAGAPSA